METLDYNAAHGTSGLLHFEVYAVPVNGTYDLLARYASADDNGRPWTATYGPFGSLRAAEEFARNLPLPGDAELGPLVVNGRGNGWVEYRIHTEPRK